MKEMDLMNAMTELDGDLLERESGARVRRFRVSRVGLIAAVVALMTVTVFAATLAIRYEFSDANDLLVEDRLDFSFPYEQVTIRPEAYEEMTQLFNSYWQEWGLPRVEEGQDHWFYVAYDASVIAAELTSMEEIENYLGLDLLSSPEIDEIADENLADDFMRWTISMYGTTSDVAYAEYQETGSVPLLGVEIGISLCEPDKNGYKELRIVIPLDERYMEYYPVDSYYEFGDSEQHEAREYSNGSCDFVIAKRDFTEDAGSRCVALYTEGGVCYNVYAIAWPIDASKTSSAVVQDPAYEYCMDAEELVLPLIENIG